MSGATPIALYPLHPLFVAEISGVDSGRKLEPETAREIAQAIDRYSVLVLRDQDLDDERQLAFAGNFGEIEAPRSARAATKRRLRPEISDISNLDENNRLRAADDPRRFDQLGNRLWHTDGSFRRVPAALSMLYAHHVPMTGGETEFADLRAAWDALPEARKRELDGLVVEHSIFRSRSQIGFADFNDEIFKQLPPVPQALVRHHPASGRTSLYLASHAGEIQSRETLFKDLFKREYDGMDRMLDIRISRLRRKLGDEAETAERIKTIWGQGYLFVPDAW